MIHAHILSGYSLGQLAIMVVALAACCALVVVACRAMGLAVPAWAQQVLTIVVVAVVVILAIQVVMGL